MRAAVVGHVEWIEFGRVDHVPAPGEIVHVSDSWQEPGGGGAVAAVQLAQARRRARRSTRRSGDDEIGHRAKRELEAARPAGGGGLPARAAAARLRARGRRGRAHDHGDRRPARAARRRPAALGASSTETDAVYFTAGDAGAARAGSPAPARWSPRRAGWRRWPRPGVELDALVASGKDPGERYEPGRPRAGRRAGGAHRRARAAGSTRRATASAAAGRPRRCPARSATCTAAATASPPA